MSNRICCLVSGLALSFLSCVTIADSVAFTIASADGAQKGVITIDLNEQRAPGHVKRIKALVSEGKYDGVAFHRVISGFMAQTGDVKFGNVGKYSARRVGTGGSEYEDLKAEFSEIPFTEGVVGMARSRYIHSANSQFFIMTDAHSGLNGQYTVIGEVVEGMSVVHQIKKGSSAQNGSVSQPDYIKQAVMIP